MFSSAVPGKRIAGTTLGGAGERGGGEYIYRNFGINSMFFWDEVPAFLRSQKWKTMMDRTGCHRFVRLAAKDSLCGVVLAVLFCSPKSQPLRRLQGLGARLPPPEASLA